MEYFIIISASLTVILSYLFNRISNLSRIPAVLMLIILGLLAKQFLPLFGIASGQIQQVFEKIKLLEVLGTLGLILIVLEASLELKLQKEKLSLIIKSFFIALLGLGTCIIGIAAIFSRAFEEMDWITAMIYATPLSILSSAIVIPSVTNLTRQKEEFHIYESTFSDILGIMAFYFLIELQNPTSDMGAVAGFGLNLALTIFLSLALSILLIYIFQNLETKIKLFLMISVLLLLYGVGKLFHLSSLIIILVFGLILNNYKLFFIGSLEKLTNPASIKTIQEAFLMITVESAFVVRTFFFVLFGFSIVLTSLFQLNVFIVSILVLIVIYLLRYLTFLPFTMEGKKQAILLAPRGLITLLLFYSIPEDSIAKSFDAGILFFVIIATSLLMTVGLFQDSEYIEEIDLD